MELRGLGLGLYEFSDWVRGSEAKNNKSGAKLLVTISGYLGHTTRLHHDHPISWRGLADYVLCMDGPSGGSEIAADARQQNVGDVHVRRVFGKDSL